MSAGAHPHRRGRGGPDRGAGDGWVVLRAPLRRGAPRSLDAPAATFELLVRSGGWPTVVKYALAPGRRRVRLAAELPADPRCGPAARRLARSTRAWLARLAAGRGAPVAPVPPPPSTNATAPDPWAVAFVERSREAGWTGTAAGGAAEIPLPGDAGLTARAVPLGRRIRIHADLPPVERDGPGAAAAGLALLRLNAGVRLARAVAHAEPGHWLPRTEVWIPEPAPAVLLDLALGAVGTAAAQVALEIEVLASEPALARAYLEAAREPPGTAGHPRGLAPARCRSRSADRSRGAPADRD